MENLPVNRFGHEHPAQNHDIVRNASSGVVRRQRVLRWSYRSAPHAILCSPSRMMDYATRNSVLLAPEKVRCPAKPSLNRAIRYSNCVISRRYPPLGSGDKSGDSRGTPAARYRQRLGRSPGGDPDGTDPRTYGTPQGAQARPRNKAWPLKTCRPTTKAPELSKRQ